MSSDLSDNEDIADIEDDKIPLFTDWSIFSGDNKRRCKDCDEYGKEKGYGDFVCKHVRGFVEAPSHVKRCESCEAWKKREKVKKDFWCKHRDSRRVMWNNYLGWQGSSQRANDIYQILNKK